MTHRQALRFVNSDSYFRKWLFLAIFVTFAVFKTPHGNAQSSVLCHKITSTRHVEGIFQGWNVNSYDLLIELENRYNRAEYSRAKSFDYDVEYSVVPSEQTKVTYMGDKNKWPEVQQLLETAKGQTRWYHHPTNENSSLPFRYRSTRVGFQAASSASRSLFFTLGENYYSIKMGTTRPRGKEGDFDDKKAWNIGEVVKTGRQNQVAIDSIDTSFGKPKKIIIAAEVASVENVVNPSTHPFDKESGGFLIRDLSFLKNPSFIYIPAFTLEPLGLRIAMANKSTFSKFWRKNYAENLGRVMAELLVHYGLQMDMPHSQNVMIELDRKLKPTGRFVIRDISDLSGNEVIFPELQNFLKNERKPLLSRSLVKKGAMDLDYAWSRFAKRAISWSTDKRVFNDRIDREFNAALRAGFIDEAAKLLEVSPEEFGSESTEIFAFLHSQPGLESLRAYWLKNLKR